MVNKRYALIALGFAFLLGAIVFFIVMKDSGPTGGDDSTFPFWLIPIFWVPIWVSLSTASREKQKRDEKSKHR